MHLSCPSQLVHEEPEPAKCSEDNFQKPRMLIIFCKKLPRAEDERSAPGWLPFLLNDEGLADVSKDTDQDTFQERAH